MPATQTDRLAGLTTSVAVKAPCRVATTGNITLSGLQSIDGVTVASGERVLVKDQTTASQNGIYKADTGAWTRAPDFDGSLDAVGGTQLYVISGDENANSMWRVAGVSSGVVIGTDAITFDVAFAVAGVSEAVSRTALAALEGMTEGRMVMLTEPGRDGLFAWTSATQATLVTADPGQGVCVPPASDTDGSSGAWVRVGFRLNGLTPEMFGFDPADGATADNNTAWDRLFALSVSLLWRETNVLADPTTIEGIPIQLSANLYEYSGTGVDFSAGGVSKTPSITGAGRGRTMILNHSDVFLLTWGQVSKFDFRGFNYSGGKGFFIQTGAVNNVLDPYNVYDCEFRDFSVCAIGSNSTDMPMVRVIGSLFAGGADAIGLALAGNTDLCEVAFCEFSGMRYHVKVGRCGNSVRLHDNFHQEVAHADGARVWVVLDSASSNIGQGGEMLNVKFGNEPSSINLTDRPFIVAEEDTTNDNFYDRYHSATISSDGWGGWNIDGCIFVGDTGQTEAVFTFFTPKVGGLSFGPSNRLHGSRRPYLFAAAAGITEWTGASVYVRNKICAPLDMESFTGANTRLSNLPGFATLIDPNATMYGQGTVSLAPGSSTSAAEVSVGRGIDYAAGASTSITVSPVLEDFGDMNAEEVTASATTSEIVLASFTPVVGRQYWVWYRVKRGNTLSLSRVRARIYRTTGTNVEKSEQIELMAGNSATVTITIATPGVITWTAHGLENGDPVVLTTTGLLPTGLTPGTEYYVSGKTTNTFRLSLTPGAAEIDTSGSPSGVHTGTNTKLLDWVIPVRPRQAGALRVALILDDYAVGARTKFIVGNFSVIESETPPVIGHGGRFGYAQGKWNGPRIIQAGRHEFWDASGNLRGKVGRPFNDTDGTVISAATVT